MKERPILFSGPMVRAILDGTKTQTRRVCNLPSHPAVTGWVMNEYGHFNAQGTERGKDVYVTTFPFGNYQCPYGVPGDRLWVRETWTYPPKCGKLVFPSFVGFRADGTRLPEGFKWRPSIHMPRWASRLALEVTGVKVERLQDISHADAIAEGCKDYEEHQITAIESYENLWRQINGLDSWEKNPWVWAITFKKLETEE